jgi:hypothetical protein
MLIRMTACAAAAVALAGAVVSAQTNPSRTIVGCVFEERNVPGRSPNIAEKVGFGEDYILAELSAAEAAKPASDVNAPTTYSMYKLEKVADTTLRSFVGKRVEVTGMIDAKATDASGQPSRAVETNETDRAIGRDRINLPEIEVTNIKEVAGRCPARPTTSN